MAVTMKELALKAHVSRTAVSMALSGKTNGHISKEKQEKILELARQCNFRPNMAAKGLRTGKAYCIGVLMPVPITTFYADMATLFQQKLAEHGYTALFSFFTSNKKENIEQAYRSVAEHGVSGIISWEYNECFATAKLPTVLFSYFPMDKPHLDVVVPACEPLAEKALEHLLGNGCSRIAMVGFDDDPRIHFFDNKLMERGLHMPDFWRISEIATSTKLDGKVRRTLASKLPPQAFVCHDDIAAARIHSLLLSMEIKIPRDIALLSFNDSTVLKVLTPSVTAFSINEDELSETMTCLLFSRMENTKMETRIKMVYPEFFIRNSTNKMTGTLE